MAVIIKKKGKGVVTPDPLVTESDPKAEAALVEKRERLLTEFIKALARQAARRDHMLSLGGK